MQRGEIKDTEGSILKKTRTDLARRMNGPGPFLFQKKEYKPIDHTFNLIGLDDAIWDGASRETILIDMHSQQLLTYYTQIIKLSEESEKPTQPDNDFIEIVSDSKNMALPKDFIQLLTDIVQQFLPPGTSDEIAHISKKFSEDNKTEFKTNAIVPLEVFLAKKKGLCRHHAAFLGYLLATHIKNLSASKKCPHQVYLYRATLEPFKSSKAERTGHAVVVLQLENKQRYLLDGTRQLVLDITSMSHVEKNDLLNLAYYPFDGVKFVTDMTREYDRLTPKIVLSIS